MKSVIRHVLAFCSLLIFCTSNAVYAENAALMELLKALHKNGTIDTATYQLVKQVAKQESAQPQIAKESFRKDVEQVVEEKIAAATENSVEIHTKGKFSIKSKDDDFEFRVGGRIQLDAATYSEDDSRHNDGTELRRIRLFASGRIWNDWNYKLQYDFTGSGINGIQDAYINYTGYKPLSIKLGHFREPFSLQSMISTNNITFTERSLLSAFDAGRNIGIQLATRGHNWTLTGGLFGEGRDGADSDNDEGYAFTGRATYSPLLSEKSRLHLGTSISHRVTGSDDSVRFRVRPESHVTNQRLVDTGNIDADSSTRFGIETALLHGPFSLQAEYIHLTIDRALAGSPDLDFSGYYAEGSWFLTGESPSYRANRGSFGTVSPISFFGQGGIGAWQLALRFSNLDLTNHDVTGGEQQNMSVALNWYTSPNIRFGINYVNVLDVKGGTSDGDEPDAFQVRAQVVF